MYFKKLFSKEGKKSKNAHRTDSIDLTSLKKEEREIITNTIALNSKTLREIIIPRVDVVMINLDTPYDKIIKIITKERNSRIPIYKDDIDDIVGVLHVKDLIDVDEKTFSLKKLMHKPYFVPISLSLLELLRNFREKQIQIAMVVDEYGGFCGIISQ